MDPMELADRLGIPRDEAKELLEGSSHRYSCRCEQCKEWWKAMGPDPDTGRYGPFTREEIEGE